MEHKTVRWMIFQPEGVDVLYLYNGHTVYLMHVAVHEGTLPDWYWEHKVDGTLDPMSTQERATLDQINQSARKKLFVIPRKGRRRYQVIERGAYLYQNS
jgi:hypothetical protein